MEFQVATTLDTGVASVRHDWLLYPLNRSIDSHELFPPKYTPYIYIEHNDDILNSKNSKGINGNSQPNSEVAMHYQPSKILFCMLTLALDLIWSNNWTIKPQKRIMLFRTTFRNICIAFYLPTVDWKKNTTLFFLLRWKKTMFEQCPQ